jgi:hypothetical protein
MQRLATIAQEQDRARGVISQVHMIETTLGWWKQWGGGSNGESGRTWRTGDWTVILEVRGGGFVSFSEDLEVV